MASELWTALPALLSPVLPPLLRASCALSLAAIAVMALRLPLRRCFGAGVAYAAWLAVPLCALAALLPAAPTGSLLVLPAAAMQPLTTGIASLASPSASPGQAYLIVLAWMAGVLLAAALQISRQRAYVRSMGAAARRGGIAYAESPHAGPALVGLWRPLIIVPSDFDRRYTAKERQLILAHERTHARRHDPLANAACAALRCLNWFNPLLHIAERLMRADQELACDAEVVRRHPNSRRSYADAMLKTQLSANDAPFACQWQSNHPLKERVMNLNRTTPQALRIAGSTLIAAAMTTGSWAAWAAQNSAPEGQLYDIAMQMKVNGDTISPHLHTRSGTPAAMRVGEGAQQWRAEFTLKPVDGGQVYIASNVSRGGKPVGKPGVLVALGQPATVKFNQDDSAGMEMQLTVTEITKQGAK
ncbi:M56 family metallopeptidase [Rugamonas aquatica]|uniref:Peptidase M56 domain-containing protein n=1 Tax=Rugamonas aquatica TaxID=2743357 RepID=A0A6A7MV34_9BURK|nr:M56 family metallopeptidase [Rugamonas aquatica]MQA36833.1 hypothetical protein [Rugamonas aquatica]